MRFGQNVYGYYQRLLKKLLEKLGLRRYAVNTHQDQFVPEPPLKNPGSAYEEDTKTFILVNC